MKLLLMNESALRCVVDFRIYSPRLTDRWAVPGDTIWRPHDSRMAVMKEESYKSESADVNSFDILAVNRRAIKTI